MRVRWGGRSFHPVTGECSLTLRVIVILFYVKQKLRSHSPFPLSFWYKTKREHTLYKKHKKTTSLKKNNEHKISHLSSEHSKIIGYKYTKKKVGNMSSLTEHLIEFIPKERLCFLFARSLCR